MRPLPFLAAPVLLLALVGCTGDDNDPDSDPSASPTRDENGLSLVDCTTLPEKDAAGPYEADEVDWVKQQAVELGELIEAGDVRYCVNSSGVPQYWALFDDELDETTAAEACAVAGATLDGKPGATHLSHGDETHDC